MYVSGFFYFGGCIFCVVFFDVVMFAFKVPDCFCIVVIVFFLYIDCLLRLVSRVWRFLGVDVVASFGVAIFVLALCSVA